MKRSHSPIFWLLFGAGGMLAALLGPALVYVTGIESGAGLLLSPLSMNYATVHAFAHHWLGKAFLFFAVSLFAWHAVHRILCSLHDIGIHKTLPVKLACYGVAALITAVSAYALAGV